jgi:hypothetical protein
MANAEYWRKVAKGWVIRPFRSWFDAHLVVHRKPELLLASEATVRCLDGHVTEEKLNLVELPAGQMTEACTRSVADRGVLACLFRQRQPPS